MLDGLILVITNVTIDIRRISLAVKSDGIRRQSLTTTFASLSP